MSRRCTELAASTKNPAARQFFETCAALWKQLAADHERQLNTWFNSDFGGSRKTAAKRKSGPSRDPTRRATAVSV